MAFNYQKARKLGKVVRKGIYFSFKARKNGEEMDVGVLLFKDGSIAFVPGQEKLEEMDDKEQMEILARAASKLSRALNTDVTPKEDSGLVEETPKSKESLKEEEKEVPSPLDDIGYV